MEVFWQRLDTLLRASVPAVLAFTLALLSVGAWPLPYLGSVMPPLAFMALFYWAAHRPDLFPPLVAFVVGLLVDLVNGGPLGLSALLYTLAHHIIWTQRSVFAGHSFVMLWMGFCLAVVLFLGAQWFLTGIIEWQAPPFFPVFVQLVLAIVFFPLPCWVFIQIQRNLLSST